MEKHIIKTSAEAKKEKDQKTFENSCPECGHPCLGSISMKSGGFLKMKSYTKKNFTCIKCRCEWTTGWIIN